MQSGTDGTPPACRLGFHSCSVSEASWSGAGTVAKEDGDINLCVKHTGNKLKAKENFTKLNLLQKSENEEDNLHNTMFYTYKNKKITTIRCEWCCVWNCEKIQCLVMLLMYCITGLEFKIHVVNAEINYESAQLCYFEAILWLWVVW